MSDPSQPELRAKPLFGLHVYCGEERGQPKYEPYDELLVEDDEWEKCVPPCSLSTLVLDGLAG